MKKLSIFTFLSIILFLSTACQSTRVEAPKENRKEYIDYSGSFGKEQTYIVSDDAFAPDSGYTPDFRNRNNFVYINLNMENPNTRKAMLSLGINKTILKEILQNAFEKTKRFSLLTEGNADKAGIILNINTDIVYSEKSSPNYKTITYDSTMTLSGHNPDRGVQEFALNIKSSEYENFVAPHLNVSNADKKELFLECVESSFSQILPELYKHYPIAGNITNARDTGSTIIFTINRGSEDGLIAGMPFVIGYNDSFGNQIFIANAEARSISANSAQLHLKNWNQKESNEVKNCIQNISSLNMDYIENMFCVSKYRHIYKK